MNYDMLYKTASVFRNAIEKAVQSGELNFCNMKFFPRGCCTVTSDLLQRYLYEKYDFFTWSVSGQIGNTYSHAWIETDNKIIIDITGDQYNYKKGFKCVEPVYVGSFNDGFHNRFTNIQHIPYQPINNSYSIFCNDDSMYKIICAHIDIC